MKLRGLGEAGVGRRSRGHGATRPPRRSPGREHLIVLARGVDPAGTKGGRPRRAVNPAPVAAAAAPAGGSPGGNGPDSLSPHRQGMQRARWGRGHRPNRCQPHPRQKAGRTTVRVHHASPGADPTAFIPTAEGSRGPGGAGSTDPTGVSRTHVGPPRQPLEVSLPSTASIRPRTRAAPAPRRRGRSDGGRTAGAVVASPLPGTRARAGGLGPPGARRGPARRPRGERTPARRPPGGAASPPRGRSQERRSSALLLTCRRCCSHKSLEIAVTSNVSRVRYLFYVEKSTSLGATQIWAQMGAEAIAVRAT